ncbi:MAG: nucleotide exchange factor GrpE [Oscillospiraceae bacterium]|nr:nucleotide exchange factor GrpE [Oscillospiraceae bacterium]
MTYIDKEQELDLDFEDLQDFSQPDASSLSSGEIGNCDLQKEEDLSEIEELKKELDAQKDNYLRLAAEYDNFRKRTAKEREQAFIDAKVSVLEDLLPVVDNMDRARDIDDTSIDEFKKGIDMTLKQFYETLELLGLKSFGEAGDLFDPNIHNAVMHVQDDNINESTVVEVFIKGYRVGDKIIRPAMVKVAN